MTFAKMDGRDFLCGTPVLNDDYYLSEDGDHGPCDGWTWFPDEQAAKDHFGITDEAV